MVGLGSYVLMVIAWVGNVIGGGDVCVDCLMVDLVVVFFMG